MEKPSFRTIKGIMDEKRIAFNRKPYQLKSDITVVPDASDGGAGTRARTLWSR